MISICFSISCLAFITIIASFYFSKSRLKNVDNKIFTILVITNIIGIILDVGGFVSFKMFGTENILNVFISKIYLIYYLTYTFCLMLYVYNVSFSNFFKIVKKLVLAFILVCFIIFLLPTSVRFEDSIAYSYGPSVNLGYVFAFIFMIFMMVCMFIRIKKIKSKVYLPLLVFILLTFVSLIVQKMYPEITLLLLSNSVVTTLMYFTIENPDIKMLSEIYKNKELVEQTYVDKSNFLFEMTQEVRSPLMNLSNLCKSIKDEDDIDTIKEKLKLINNRVRELDFVVNDVLNVSSLDVQKVKFIRNKYSLKNIYEDLVNKVNFSISNSVEFRSKIPENIPFLEGDSIKLKQVLLSLLLNSVKKTKEGFIEFRVDTIEKYDVCRLIFTITDSGTGMSIDKINEILSTTSEFDSNDIKELEKSDFNIKLCQKIAKAAGGNLLIKSNPGKGTEIILTIDQAIYNPSSKESIIDKYESAIVNKRVLIISQDKEINNIIKKRLQEENITTSIILNGNDGIDKIKSKKTYDYIIIEDEMNGINGYNTMKEINKINSKLPLIVLLKENKENIKDHYIDDGFKDYIIKENVIEDLNRIIKKY